MSNDGNDPLEVEIPHRLKIVTQRGGFVFVSALSLAIVIVAFGAMPLGMKVFDRVSAWLMALIG